MAANLKSAEILRRGGNMTVTYRLTWDDNCEQVLRTATTYQDARVVKPSTRSCGEHGKSSR